MNGRIPKHFEFDTKLVQDICKLIGKHLTEKELISNIFKFRQYKYWNFAHLNKALQELVEFVHCKYKRIDAEQMLRLDDRFAVSANQ